MPPFKVTNMDESENKRDSIKGGVPFLTIPGKEGEWVFTRIRILPVREDHPDDTFFHYVATHGNIPGAGHPIYCPAKNDNGYCPACVIADQAYKRGDKDTSGEWYAGWKALMNVVVLNKDGSWPDDAEIKVWGISRELLLDLQAKAKAVRDAGEPERYDFTHPFTGSDVIVSRMGTGRRNTKYGIAIAPVSSEIPSDKYGLFDTLIDLPRVYRQQDGESIQRLIDGPQSGGKVFDDTLPALGEGGVIDAEYTAIPEVADEDAALAAMFAEAALDADEEDDISNPGPQAEVETGTPKNVQDEARARLLAQMNLS